MKPSHILKYSERSYVCSCGTPIAVTRDNPVPLREALYKHAEHVQEIFDLLFKLADMDVPGEWSRGFNYDELGENK